MIAPGTKVPIKAEDLASGLKGYHVLVEAGGVRLQGVITGEVVDGQLEAIITTETCRQCGHTIAGHIWSCA